jgi:hypothetical protein
MDIIEVEAVPVSCVWKNSKSEIPIPFNVLKRSDFKNNHYCLSVNLTVSSRARMIVI